MDAVLLARLQFALTVGLHFIFAPLTIGLSWVIFWLMTRYRKSGAALDRYTARFWIDIFTMSFVVGVATGLTMEFQFGTNWANYSRFVGDIFGAPLAAEALFAFFLESVFLGVLLFGWERVSRTALWVSSLLVAIGATMSAFWILIANSWMQTPAGYTLRNGRAELSDFWAAVFNPSTGPRILHTVDAAIMTGALFVLGISAWFLLKKRHVESARITLLISLVIGFITALGQLPSGHYHAMQVAATQPAKLAAMEGLFETRAHAPLLLFGMPDVEQRTVRYAIRIPGGLSLLASGNSGAVVTGLNDIPRNEWPNIPLTFYPFHFMVALGCYFIALTGLGIALYWRKKLYTNRFFLSLAWLSIPLPFLANELGWITAEVGRQPWIVYKIQRTQDAVSVTVPAGQIFASMMLFMLVYSLVFVVWLTFLRMAIRKGPEPVHQLEAQIEVQA